MVRFGNERAITKRTLVAEYEMTPEVPPKSYTDLLITFLSNMHHKIKLMAIILYETITPK